MTREKLIEKLQRGETVTPEMLAAVQNAEQLEQLQSEAAERNNVANIEAARAAKRENAVQRLIEADSEAEAGTREYENLCRQFDYFIFHFGKRLLAAKARIISAQVAFGNVIKAEIPRVDKIKNNDAPEVETALELLLETVKERGAKLKSVCSEDWQPHLLYSPPFCRANAYEPPKTVFGDLLFRVERMVATLPEPPPETAEKPKADLELWAFAQAEAFRAGIEPAYGDVETTEKAA